ncbi:MAG: hypothetical protein ACRDFS_07340 [Chloroflexota bacterium]
MIENQAQKSAALNQIQYWKTQIAGQSWLGGERARAEIMRLRDEIDVYDKAKAESAEPSEPGAPPA